MESLQETVSYHNSNHLYSHYLLDPLYNNGKARYLLDQAKMRISSKKLFINFLIVNFKVGRSRRESDPILTRLNIVLLLPSH